MLKSKAFQWSFFGLIAAISIFITFKNLKHEDRDCNSYDEQMWTSSSIASYNMFFKGHERNLTYIDNWFATYAIGQDLDVFTKYQNPNFDPMAVKFPYDYAANKAKTATFEVEIDTVKFPKKYYQWFDKSLWTFGWRAPNMGKYIMGWYIQTFSKEKPNPNGYFEFLLPDNSNGNYQPSTQFTTTSFSYAPTNYVEMARIPNAIAAVLIILAVFYVGWKGINFWVGAGAAIWLLSNTPFINTNTAAGLDSFSILFTFGSIFLLYYSLNLVQKNASLKSIIISSSITGIAMAFAVGSKLNGALVFYICAILYVFALARVLSKKHRIENIKNYLQKLFLSGAITGVLGLGLFVFFNPQMQVDPLKMAKVVQTSTDAYFEKRATKFCEDQIRTILDSTYASLKYIYEHKAVPAQEYNSLQASYNQSIKETQAVFKNDVFFKNEQKTKRYLKLINHTASEILKHNPNSSYSPSEFINWVYLKNNFSESAKLVNERIGYVANPDRYYATLGNWINFKFNPMDGAFALLGLIALLAIAWTGWKSNKITIQLVIALSFIVIWYGNTDFIWQDWNRYFVSMFPLYSLIIMSGIFYSIQWILNKRKKG